VRMVDVDSDGYGVMRAYTVRLERSDFEDGRELARLAAAAHLTPERFREELGYLTS